MAAPRYCAGRVLTRCGRARLASSAVVLCFALLDLTGCRSTEPPGSGAAVGNVPLECAPFARAVSGVQLRGVAADWWPQAEGRYRGTQTPAVGSVLVFRRSARLPDGHVAVVSRVLSDRRILATHANWVRHQVSEDVPVIDISPGNDWTKVRVWWPPTNQMGVTEYATFKFVEAKSLPEHDQISANARQLINIAISE
jgi:CHAP domain